MSTSTYPATDWPELAKRIHTGCRTAVEELYLALLPVRSLLARNLGQDCANDLYHTMIIDIVVAIKKGVVRNPGALPLYARTIARRAASTRFGQLVRERRTLDTDEIDLRMPQTQSPEALLMNSELEAVAKRVLSALPSRDQEVLRRFYLDEESPETIKLAMNLTDTQFRLIKSRAKLRYTELVQQALSRSKSAPRCSPNSRSGSEPSGMLQRAL